MVISKKAQRQVIQLPEMAELWITDSTFWFTTRKISR